MNQHVNKPVVVFIEPYGASVSLLKRGIERGYFIIVLSANRDMRVVPSFILQQVQRSIVVDTADETAVLSVISDLLKELTIHAVIPGFEYFVPIAAKASAMAGVPGIPVDRVSCVRQKDLMRAACHAHGLTVPRYAIIDLPKEIDAAIEDIGFPAICKPTDAAGSVHVACVNDRHMLIEAYNKIGQHDNCLWGHTLSRRVLLEEYIAGKEYSLEGVVSNGQVYHFSITEKFVNNQAEFIEIGHIVNVPVKAKLAAKMKRYVEETIQALGINHCPFHAELRINGQAEPVLMEIAARLAGDKIGDLINTATGINYFDYVYAAYLGQAIVMSALSDGHAGIRFFYRPEIEQYHHVSGLEHEETSIEDIAIYYEPGAVIPGFPKPLRRLGHVIAVDTCYRALCQTLTETDRRIIFHVS